MAKTAYMFPGQGSQYVGMGKDLYESSEAAREIFHAADETLGFSLSTLCFDGPDEELKKTVNAQPALLTVSMACLAAARERLGDAMPSADFMAGHSLGEYTALTASGSLDFATAVRLARERGRLMYEAGLQLPGTMAAVIAMEAGKLEEICKATGAYIANLNCPGQIAISGTVDAVKAASTLARERGAKLAVQLQVSGAFHSPMMLSAAEGMRACIRDAKISLPRIPVIGNTMAQMLDNADSIRRELTEQVCGCVHWQETIENLLKEGVDTFIEIGPGKVLTGLVKRVNKEARTINLGTLEEITALCA